MEEFSFQTDVIQAVGLSEFVPLQFTVENLCIGVTKFMNKRLDAQTGDNLRCKNFDF